MKTLVATIASLVALAAAGTPSAATAAKAFAVHQDPAVPQLLVPGDRVELGYRTDSSGVKSLTGTLFVRTDLQQRFSALALAGKGQAVSTILPARFLRGHRLFYYAVIRDPGSKRSVTTGKQSAWILQKPVVVRLRKHAYGQTRQPDAVVARASAAVVGWDTGGEFNLGPQTLNVAPDGSVWLQDSYNSRLLAWNPGQPDNFARAVPLPGFAGGGDFVFGRDGTIYASSPGFLGADPLVFHLGPSGEVLWSARLPAAMKGVGELALRVGPDGTVYGEVGGEQTQALGGPAGEWGWLPVATPTGKTLPVAYQTRHVRWGYQPLAGGRRLVSAVYTPPRSQQGPKDVRYALIGRNGRLVRTWRVLSRTQIFPGGGPFFTPQLVGGDPVIDLDVARPGQIEHVVLRLGQHGAKSRFSLPYSIFGEGTSYADLRIGPDGKLYRLATSPTNGVTISRYSLQP
jgi:hypothetical protein